MRCNEIRNTVADIWRVQFNILPLKGDIQIHKRWRCGGAPLLSLESHKTLTFIIIFSVLKIKPRALCMLNSYAMLAYSCDFFFSFIVKWGLSPRSPGRPWTYDPVMPPESLTVQVGTTIPTASTALSKWTLTSEEMSSIDHRSCVAQCFSLFEMI